MPRHSDLLLATFRTELKRLGFAYVAADQTFFDLQRRGAAIPGVRRGRGLDRKSTLAKLLNTRAERETDAKRRTAEMARQAETAAKIAPCAIQPARAGLSGADAIAGLADDFILQTTRSEGAVIEDLLLLGWERGQIDQYAPAARTLAYRRQDVALA